MAAGLQRSSSSSSSKNVLPPQELVDDLCRDRHFSLAEWTNESLDIFKCNKGKFLHGSMDFVTIIDGQTVHQFFSRDIIVSSGPGRSDEPAISVLMRMIGQNYQRKDVAFMFNSCDALRPYIAHIDNIYKDFTSYKFRVPVTGAIILDESYERCLLVKGWKAGASWSFPRGKKGKDEEDHTCAVREVLEETGFDVSKLLKMDDFIEVIIGQQRIRLYIIAGVKEDTEFAPLTKKEISEISWHRLDELQPAGENAISRGANGFKLYMVAPFLNSLKSWISTHPPSAAKKSDTSVRGTCVWKAKNSSGSGAAADNTLLRASSESQVRDTAPGKSFRSFKFDTASILRSMDAAFSVN